MKNLSISLVLLLLITGCGTTRMYQGPALKRGDVALIFIMERPNFHFNKIDSKPVNFLYDGQVLEFEPGIHTFDFELSTLQMFWGGGGISQTTDNISKVYHFELDMKPGYTYVIDRSYQNTHLPKRLLPDELCFLGELHDAPGSSVNVTGEYKTMSSEAKKVACAIAN